MTALNINKLSRKQQIFYLKVITHIAALIPLVWLYFDFYTYNLGSDEIRAALFRTGKPALWLLVISLAITPLNLLFGWKPILPLRKPLGLYAFMYVMLHFIIFAFGFGYVSREFVPALVWEEIVFRRYALVGFASFLILIPLAATSTKWAMRKLGKNWRKLHRWVYLAAILAVVHYFWLIKNDYTQPAIIAAILAFFLILRIDVIKTWVRNQRKRRRA
ncbi:MAG: protein-methionine-sulfoxide reductase heme-binding subunit MsrQ [Chloroflexota bacterium]